VFKKLESLGYLEITEKTVEGRVRHYGTITEKGMAWLKEIDEERK